MGTLKDKLAKARTAAPNTTEIQIALDATAVETIGGIEQEILAADTRYEIQQRKKRAEIAEFAREDRMSDPRITSSEQEIAELEQQRAAELATLQQRLDEASLAAAESLVTIRFTRMPGQDWAQLCAVNPPREGVLLDSQYGYDYQAVGREAAMTSGVYVDDDDTAEIDPEDWAEIFERSSGHEFERMCSALFSLNEWAPEQAVRILGKASRDAASRKSLSLSPSASPRDDSPAGNPQKSGTSNSPTDAQAD